MKQINEMLNSISPPLLTAQWFHAIDSPIVDPIAVRKKKRFGIEIQPTSPKCWVPFSKRDNTALEKAFLTNNQTVPVNEDYLFEVNISKREISPVYWEGPVFEVRRAIWFMQLDGTWVPCEEKMSKQIEDGYLKHKPYQRPTIKPEEENTEENTTDSKENLNDNNQIKKPEIEQHIEEKEFLLGPYLGQYVVYTGSVHAWLLYDTPSANMAKNFLEKLTNHQILGGKKLIRGYREVTKEKKQDKEKEEANEKDGTKKEDETDTNTSIQEECINEKDPQKRREINDKQMIEQEADDYENEDSEEDVRCVDHLVFVIHGIGQRMSERLGQNFVHDVNLLRKTMKSTWPIALSGTKPLDRSNGIQVLPILWRNSILFGADDEEEDMGHESDLGLSSENFDDGCPTIDEITLDGTPNIRTLVSDVFLDIPMYLTSRYHDQMIQVVTKEVNRVYKSFVERNPQFLKNGGKVSILGHSLGSLLAFDLLSVQPFAPNMKPDTETFAVLTEKKPPVTLDFPIKNFFAVGSPLGMIMLLRSHKIVSRKTLITRNAQNSSKIPSLNKSSSLVSFVYPAVDNVYNIFHKSDPVAYRLEPLIVRHYGAKLKPMPIPYIKGGLKSVFDAGFVVGNDIASKAGAMFESFKSNITSSMIMRGLGLAKPSEETQLSLNQRSQSNPEILASKVEAKSVAKLEMLNPAGRVDFCLQEGLLENAYISALSVHMSYWQDVDVAGFLIREIYKKEEPMANLIHSKTAHI